ncbi:MAG: TlpA disulfide reductase family protein [Cyclobacteriaceae bacterium]
MIQNSPFDNNVTLLTESTIFDGRFELIFELPYDSEIIFSVNDLTVSKQIIDESRWDIDLNIIELPKPDFYGKTERLELTQAKSSNEQESELFNIESDIESIKENNRKGNGKIGRNYSNELEQYLIEKIRESNSSKLNAILSTSSLFVFSLSGIMRDKGHSNELETFFQDNFQFSYSGLVAVNILYAQSIQIEFLTKELGKSNYFEFIKEAASKIEDDRIRQSTLAVLVTNAIGRKWTNQQETKEQLSAFIDQCEYPELTKWLMAFQDYHSSTLVGSKLQDFELENPNGDIIRFSDYEGKYLLIDFWATWCGPCIKNMKKLPELKGQNSNLEVLCVTTEQDMDRINKFIARNGYENTLNFGIARNHKEIDSYFNKRAIPLYFLISPDGVIIDKAVTDPTSMIEKHLNTKSNRVDGRRP